jgi:excinuclease UvrABC nuclease subunit
VSDAKKKALLTGFGSITRIKKASVEDLAKTPGISSDLAATILAQLGKPRGTTPKPNSPCD